MLARGGSRRTRRSPRPAARANRAKRSCSSLRSGLRGAAIGDVPDQDVVKAQLLLAGQGALGEAGSSRDERASADVGSADGWASGGSNSTAACGQNSRPITRGPLDERALAGAESIEACRQQALDRRRDLAARRPTTDPRRSSRAVARRTAGCPPRSARSGRSQRRSAAARRAGDRAAAACPRSLSGASTSELTRGRPPPHPGRDVEQLWSSRGIAPARAP